MSDAGNYALILVLIVIAVLCFVAWYHRSNWGG